MGAALYLVLGALVLFTIGGAICDFFCYFFMEGVRK